MMDVIWGEIPVSPLALKFIDIYEFQRMRFMKQLGTCNYVYTCAEASRFSHSLGVYFLACRVVRVLKDKHTDLVSDRLEQMIPIAALYHDIGHGPLSHVFDIITETKHEHRSKAILKFVIDKYEIDEFSNEEITIMQNMMEPTENEWYYNIVSNDTVDVDRMDYLVRDSYSTGVKHLLGKNDVLKLIDRSRIVDGKWNFPLGVHHIVDDLLNSRTHMYNRVYRHPVMLGINQLITIATKDVLLESSQTLESFLTLSDSIIQDIYNDPDTPHEKRHILGCIFRRQLLTRDKKF
jgi:HD superfamily phosphohydrolase